MLVGFDIEGGAGYRLMYFAWRHRVAIALGAITVAAALLRFATLGDQSLDHDETVTAARVIHPSFFRSMNVVFNGERSPPLYYAVIWLWSRVWGTGVVAVRSLSAVFGTITVVLAYFAGRELASRRAGLVAALLVALNPYLIWYSQEARSYGALVMFGALALYFFARARRTHARRPLAGWAIASGLALLSHYFAVFFIVPEALLLLIWSEPGRRRATAMAVAVVAAVGLAVMPLAVMQEGSGRGNGFTQFPVAQRVETALVKYATVEGAAPQAGILSTTPVEREIGLIGVGLVAVAVLLVMTRGSPTERRGAGVAAGVAVAAFGVPVLMAWGGFDYVDPRNLIGAVVPALIALGIGLSVRGAGLGVLATLGCAATFAYGLHAESTTPAMQRHDWQAAASTLPQRHGGALRGPAGRTDAALLLHRPQAGQVRAAALHGWSRDATDRGRERLPARPQPGPQVPAGDVPKRATALDGQYLLVRSPGCGHRRQVGAREDHAPAGDRARRGQAGSARRGGPRGPARGRVDHAEIG